MQRRRAGCADPAARPLTPWNSGADNPCWRAFPMNKALSFAVFCVAATTFAGAQQPAPAAQPAAASAPLTAADAARPADHDRPVRERPALLRPHEQEAREARRAAARRQRRLDPRRRRPAGARALRRAHGVQRHEALSRSRRSSTFIESIGMRFGADVNAFTSFDETVYMLQVPTDKPEVARPGAAHPRGLGAQRDVRSGRDRQGARRRHGGVAAAPRRRRAHAGQAVSRSCSRARATPTGCRSARPRSSRTSSTSG